MHASENITIYAYRVSRCFYISFPCYMLIFHDLSCYSCPVQIPTTRAVSPKLGRNKNSTSTTNSSESGGSCFSPRVVKEQVKSPRALLSTRDKVTGASKGKPVETKKPIMKSTSTSKTKVKAVGTKSKPAEPKALDENTSAEKPQEMLEQPDEKSEITNAEQPSNAVIMPSAQVTVEV